MIEKSDSRQPIETIPSANGGISALASANAPFIYFENAPFYGLFNGIGQITLEANRNFGADADGSPRVDRAIVAHLRGNIQAFIGLRAALDGIILMAQPKPDSPAN